METLKRMKFERHDLSNYLIHFTRRGEKYSFDILKDIVFSGRINCSWSIRGDKRTIFGRKPAICFTEMPLFSFYMYVLNRKDSTKVDFYGIALPKKRMFQLGARNVIYGTTSISETEQELESGEWGNPGLPASEQYRYMLTNIDDKNDWTHEREWRWANILEQSCGDYLPIWKNNKEDVSEIGEFEFFQQLPIFIIVRFEEEILCLKELFSRFTNRKVYNCMNINNTFAISLERLEKYKNFDLPLDFFTLIKEELCHKIIPYPEPVV